MIQYPRKRNQPPEEMSFSSMSLHRKCPQAWAYRYIRRLESNKTDDRIPMIFGNWWHALRAADAIVRGREAGSLMSCPESLRLTDGYPELSVPDPITREAFRRLVISNARDYWNHLSPELHELWRDTIGTDLVSRLLHADKLWRETWADELETQLPIAVEYQFKVQLPGIPTVIPGAIDEIYRDRKRGIVVIKDHKTSKSLTRQSAEDDMMEPQLPLYAYAAKDILAEWGYHIGALSYDRIRSTAPKTPKFTKAGALAKVPSDYDLDTYRDWAAGPDGEGLEYEKSVTLAQRKVLAEERECHVDEVEKVQTLIYEPDPKILANLAAPTEREKWAMRTLSPVNRNLMLSHLRAAVNTAREIGRTLDQFARYGEATRNLGSFFCKNCEFAKLCRAEMIGGVGGEYALADYDLKEREESR